jgi:hypothetical protein
MKLINETIGLVASAAIVFASCATQELHDLNINPQVVDEMDVNFIFTAAQLVRLEEDRLF